MTSGNETNAGQTWGAPIHIMVFSYLPCDRRDRVLFRTSRRNYYPAAWEFATAREPKHLNLPFRNFLRLSKPRSWTGDPEHVKYQSISLGPLAHAGLMMVLIFYIGVTYLSLVNFTSCHFFCDSSYFLKGYIHLYILSFLNFVQTSGLISLYSSVTPTIIVIPIGYL